MDRYSVGGLIALVVFIIWFRGWRIRCLVRGHHHWLIPDVAVREGMEDTAFPGMCRDCGKERIRSGAAWLAVTQEAKRLDGKRGLARLVSHLARGRSRR